MTTIPDFKAPGSDGTDLDPATSLWRKGLVYTAPQSIDTNYRLFVGFKGRVAAHPFTGFHDVYRRVSGIAYQRIRQRSEILCHGWRWLGENIVTAFINLGLSGCNSPGKPVPTHEELCSPGGATLEELTQLAPQHSDEIFNEFDFTDPSTTNSDLVTLSYGEAIPRMNSVNFEPFINRAETLAKSYHVMLQTFGEARTDVLRVRRREWFLASDTFVTIHICFEQ